MRVIAPPSMFLKCSELFSLQVVIKRARKQIKTQASKLPYLKIRLSVDDDAMPNLPVQHSEPSSSKAVIEMPELHVEDEEATTGTSGGEGRSCNYLKIVLYTELLEDEKVQHYMEILKSPGGDTNWNKNWPTPDIINSNEEF